MRPCCQPPRHDNCRRWWDGGPPVGIVRVEKREARGLTCGLLDSARALEVVKVRRGEAGARSVEQPLLGEDSDSLAACSRLGADFAELWH